MLRTILLTICLFFTIQAAPAETIPNSRAEIAFSFAPVVKKAAPSVVNVYTTKRTKNPDAALLKNPMVRELFGDFGITIPKERVQSSLGSGVIVSSSGLVMTNNHVIADADEIKVVLQDKREFEAKIVLKDKRTDLAVLRLQNPNGEKFSVIEMGDADSLQVGDLVLAIGNPFGVGQTVTSGIVSALARTQVGVSDYQFFIQTDAAINPGNSGGALVDMAGRLVGINTAIYSRSGGSVGIGFAIPSGMVRLVIASAEKGSAIVQRPYIGVKLQNVTSEIAEAMKLPRPAGALVVGVTDKSPAHKAGLKQGDVIIAVDGQEINDGDSFGFRIATHGVGGTSDLTIMRQGRQQVLKLVREVAPETTPRQLTRISGRSYFSGLQVANLSPAVAEELSLEVADNGVVVVDVAAGSIAARVGLKRGDILVALNGLPILNVNDVQSVADNPPPVWRINLLRDGEKLTAVLGR